MKSKTNTDCIIENYNSTENPFCFDNLNQLIAGSFIKHAGSVAVSHKDSSLTYSELDRLSDEIAADLMEKGVRPGDCVGVYAEKKVETVANILAVLKAGGAYVPINPDLPEAMQRYVIENSSCAAKLMPGEISFAARGRPEKKIKAASGDTAYIIYTSGSTGLPKGVIIPHMAVTNTVMDINERFNITEHDKFIGLSSFCFDLSVYDIFGALSTGSELVLVENQRDMAGIKHILDSKKITFWNSVPAFLEFFLDEAEDDWTSLYVRNIFLSGDWIPLKLIDKIKKHFPRAAIVSLGGATEASVWSIYYVVEELDTSWKSIPYGYPLANQRIYILDDTGKRCPIGEKGEICIGGAGVARGYINDKEKTEKAFVETSEYGRIYRTGDYGILKGEGYVEFCGRLDEQVKVNGFRIEMGEIEAQALKCRGVKEAKAVVLQSEDAAKFIGLAYVSDGQAHRTSHEVKAFLKENLPYYSVPTVVEEIPEIPVTPNGKTDKKKICRALAEKETSCLSDRDDTELEKQLIEIWKEALEEDSLTRDSNFFLSGGNSLKAMRIMEDVAARGLASEKLPLNAVFTSSTIYELACTIEEFNKNSEKNEADENYEEGEI